MRLSVFLLMAMCYCAGGFSLMADKPIWEYPPRRDLPPLTEELKNKIKNEAVSSAKLKTDEGGVTRLRINGKMQPLIVGDIGPFAYVEATACYDTFSKAQIDVNLLAMDVAYFHRDLGYVGPRQYMESFWLGKKQYNYPDVEKVLWRMLRANPNAKIILWLGINNYPAWAEENPDELVRNNEGKLLVMEHHFKRYEGKTLSKLPQRDQYVPSFFSEKYRTDLNEALTELVKTVEASIPGKAVVGYLLGGGVDYQLYSVNPPDNIIQGNSSMVWDYSRPAVIAWRKWLQKKYNDNSAQISAAWGIPVNSFAEIEPPPEMFPGKSRFLSLPDEQKIYDWKRFIAGGRAEFIGALAKALKSASAKDIIVGAAAGDSGARRDLTSSYQLITNPDIDFFFHQPTYGKRLPPSAGGINSLLDTFGVNQKIFLTDMDHRTWLVKPYGATNLSTGVSYNSTTVGRADNIEVLDSMWVRELTRLGFTGNGAIMRREKPWDFEDPAIIRELNKLLHLQKDINPQHPANPPEDMVVIYDEDSVDYANKALSELHHGWSAGGWEMFNRSGVPWRGYYAGDLRNGKVPEGKIYFLVNILNFDEKLCKSIEKLKKDNAVLVFMQATGYANIANMEEVNQATGIKLGSVAAVESSPVNLPVEEGKHQQLRQLRIDEDAQGGICVMDKQALAYKKYTNGKVAVALKDFGTYKTIFVGAYYLSPANINMLANFANVWSISPPENVVATNGEYLMIHPIANDNICITLKTSASLEQFPDGKITSDENIIHNLALRKGSTYIFKMSKPQKNY